MDPRAEMFRNRLRKNLARLAPWAKQRGIAAYRLYDRDIPEVGLAVDWYDGQVHVAEYARRGGSPAEQAACLKDVLAAVCELCGVGPSEVHLKLRERQKGLSQYEKLGAQRHERAVPEGGHRFLVNLSDYLDTGLFLDHRDTRRMVGERAAGRRVLNLFGYTGSFTVYAARGGAEESTTVDLSNTYLGWAERNFALNGLPLRRHQLVRADVLRFLQDAPASQRYDLIVLDPPTFSNSKAMTELLDIQRDHPRLLRGALRLLSPGGALYFSSNFRRLQLRPEEVPEARIVEITEQTLPRDFHEQRAHRTFLVSHA